MPLEMVIKGMEGNQNTEVVTTSNRKQTVLTSLFALLDIQVTEVTTFFRDFYKEDKEHVYVKH
jgi:hypothetical protein